MKRILLAALIGGCILPVLPYLSTQPGLAAAQGSSLGDLNRFYQLADETAAFIEAGQMGAAAAQMTMFENAWDEAAPRLRPLDPGEWTRLDHLADRAISELRTDPVRAQSALREVSALSEGLRHPATRAAGGKPPAFSLANSDGSPVPCEEALAEVRRVATTKQLAGPDKATVDELQAKGIERCNADDDRRADGFLGDALAILNK